MFDFFTGRLVAVRVVLLATAISLVAVGVVTLYAMGNPADPSPVSQTQGMELYWQRQLIFAAVGVMGFLAANALNYRKLGAASWWIYSITLVLLAVLLLDRFVNIPFVPVIAGTRRWIRFGSGRFSISIQPSEFCKLAYILVMAWYLRFRSNYRSMKTLIGPFALTLVPIALILSEPDLGTVVMLMPVLFAMLYLAGAKARHLLLIIAMAIVCSPFFWYMMRPYQRARISAVLLQSEWLQEKAEENPRLAQVLVGGNFSRSRWQRGWGYHLTRSKFAVASGGMTGYGFARGPFIRYNFLPERQNDFIFAIIAHQWGFLGAIGILLLYAILIWCGVEIALHNTDPFAKLLAAGIVTMFAVEVLVNVSMTLGLMPITGLTLPFVSYGGSSLLVTMTAVGLLNNVGRCRPFTVAKKK